MKYINFFKYSSQSADAYSESCQTSKVERLAKKVNALKPLPMLAEWSILDV